MSTGQAQPNLQHLKRQQTTLAPILQRLPWMQQLHSLRNILATSSMSKDIWCSRMELPSPFWIAPGTCRLRLCLILHCPSRCNSQTFNLMPDLILQMDVQYHFDVLVTSGGSWHSRLFQVRSYSPVRWREVALTYWLSNCRRPSYTVRDMLCSCGSSIWAIVYHESVCDPN